MDLELTQQDWEIGLEMVKTLNLEDNGLRWELDVFCLKMQN